MFIRKESWEEIYFNLVYSLASRSKDPRTKIGAVLVKNQRIISFGYNNFPEGIDDSNPYRLNRDVKHNYIVHAEENAILDCAVRGISSVGAILYTNGLPCPACSRMVIVSKIKEVVIHEKWIKNEENCVKKQISKRLLSEAGVKITFFKKEVNKIGKLNDKIVNV